MFSDRGTNNSQVGRGGVGCVSFRREKYVPRGGPNGGDGGHGGDVELVASDELRDLSKFRFASHFKGRRGTHGQGSGKHGRSGGDLVVEVPVGTQVWLRDEEMMLADLGHPGARGGGARGGGGRSVGAARAPPGAGGGGARGGGGGGGNRRYATATHRAPTVAELGEPGD